MGKILWKANTPKAAGAILPLFIFYILIKLLKVLHDERGLKSLKNKEKGQDGALQALRLEVLKQ